MTDWQWQWQSPGQHGEGKTDKGKGNGNIGDKNAGKNMAGAKNTGDKFKYDFWKGAFHGHMILHAAVGFHKRFLRLHRAGLFLIT